MDHFIQIPQVGRHWDDMLDSWTTLGFLAGRTRTATLGTMVTGVTYRNVAHLGKMAATLDVLSGGRAVCGIGAAWFEREHQAYGWEFPPARRRLDLLEDALQLLPLVWGPGAPSFEGKVVDRGRGHLLPPAAPGADPDPRRRVGREADAPAGRPVRRRLQPDRRLGHRPPEAGRAARALRRRGPRSRPPSGSPTWARPSSPTTRRPARQSAQSASAVAGTVEEQVGRYRELAEAGVQTAIVRLADLDEAAVERFAPVIRAFR